MQSKTPDVEELGNILDRLERRTNEISELDTKIATSYTDDSEIEAAMEDALLYNDLISSWKNKIDSFLKELASKEFYFFPKVESLCAAPLHFENAGLVYGMQIFYKLFFFLF